jgi:predicted aconitase
MPGCTVRAGKAKLHFDARSLPESWRGEDVFAHLIGHHVGGISRAAAVPVISGLLADTAETCLKAISSAAAASGGVEFWHGTGVTPEAPELAPSSRERGRMW